MEKGCRGKQIENISQDRVDNDPIFCYISHINILNMNL